MQQMPSEHLHFVTGRLAQRSLESIVPQLAAELNFTFSIEVLPITVAALMSPAWIAKHWQVPSTTSRIILPGYCEGDLTPLQSITDATIEIGPRDLRQLPRYFSKETKTENYGNYDIEIIAEINHCPKLELNVILQMANHMANEGADWIDVGCIPGETWTAVGETVRALKDQGHRVSIDSINPEEIQSAVESGAELVLSVNSSNREAAADWGVEVIAIPDDPRSLEQLDETIDFLAKAGVQLRIDPILEPISFGFANSLGRYLDIRKRYPDAEMMMGIGNLTELTDVDSAGINALLLGFCQEMRIRSVLTTQVINWARSSVRECDLARRLMFFAIEQQMLPKHIESRLIMLRDEEIVEKPVEEIARLAEEIRDNNYRIFTSDQKIHLVSNDLHLHSEDPFVIMERLLSAGPNGSIPKNLDNGHAFYLGYEMCKALTALSLGKTYCQDEALNWGLATRPENRHYLKPKRNAKSSD